MTLSARIASFVAYLPRLDLPEDCLRAARFGMTDCVGVMLAGAAMDAPSVVSRTLSETAGPWAPEVGTGRKLAPRDAALVNGTAAHVLDFDDMAMDAHPSAVLAPAILAVGAARDCSGADALRAYVAGYETWAFLKDVAGRTLLQDRGFHTTGIFGPLGAAVASASLMRLDEVQTANAVGMAASMSGGLVANFGSMAKSVHCGRAAQAGVYAAELAAAGLAASADALDHPLGFVRAYFPEVPLDGAGQVELAGRWRLRQRGVNIKRYPVCYLMHGMIDTMIDVASGNDLEPAAVNEIRVEMGEEKLTILRNHRPTTALEAKFSLEFGMACALAARNVGLSQVTDAFVAREDVANLMAKVTTIARPATKEHEDRLSVRLNDGREIGAKAARYPKGSWKNPMNDGEFAVKFLDCASQAGGKAEATRLFEQLMRLEEVKSTRDLVIGG